MNVLELANEVGFVAYGEDCGEYRIPTPAFHTRLKRFAHLVQADALERAAAVADEYAEDCWIGDREWEAAKMIAEDIRNLKDMK